MTQRTHAKRPTFIRLDEQERADAQEAADALFDGNLSMLGRKAIREFVARWRERKDGEAAA